MPAIDAVLTTTPRWPCSSGSLAAMAAAARRVTLKVPNAFISMVPTNAALSWGVPSRPDGTAAADAAAGHVDDERQHAERLRRLDGGADVAVVVHVAGHRHGRVTELLGQRLGSVAVTVEDRDAGADPDEVADRGGAEAARAARDQR